MDHVFVRMPSAQFKIDLLQGSLLTLHPERRPRASLTQSDTMVMQVDDVERHRLQDLGAKIYDDVQFEVLPGGLGGGLQDGPAAPMALGNLKDVIEQIGAPEAWERSRGRGVSIVVIDTGVHADLREIGLDRRSAIDLADAYRGQVWADDNGHGSMCAAIAAGSSVTGRYDGVAPEAQVLSARTNLKSVDLYRIYDRLMRQRQQGLLEGPVVATNSYGLYVCDSPDVMPDDHPYMSIVEDAIASGIFVCFAAGNNHHSGLCEHQADQCGPNSIWGPNSHDDVFSIGTVDRLLTNCDTLTPHADSSRGPGEWAKRFFKPDCVAPTYGEVPWGSVYRRMGWWGTSGACPQVAGLAALILSVAPAASPAQVAQLIRETCSGLPLGSNCVGSGVIDCVAAVDRAVRDWSVA
ncbi:S8 family serine peptidase [Ancylobacter sonchi]|uniref:S8 family peptidase n=1 Tax=Ancylobacter sonchi TaxID=1937790 RepID=UPI001BD275FF|nr:S8 family serine peptidase [Ancylobacter sonchi]MBS7532975.1 S8 family serine peptidase [Ancylobacter sonchi]